MNSFWKSYKSTFILLGAIILGGMIGAIMGTDATMFKPIGDLFLNLLFMTLVPLVFFSVTSAISNMSEMKRLGKILTNVVIVFAITAIIAGIIGLVGVFLFNPTQGLHLDNFKSLMDSADSEINTEKVGILQNIVNTFTVSDFKDLLSKSNMLQLIVFSMLFGIAIALAGEKARPMAKFVAAGSYVMMKIINIIMYIAPVGLGCYFAAVIGELGTQILSGYAKVFVLYLILSIICYVILFSLYAYFAGGKDGVKIFWKNIMIPTVTALATCSSAACIPVNLEAVKKMGVPEDIAETVIPLGPSIHKDGSVVGGILKITFLLGLFGRDITGISTILGILGVAFLVGAVMGAIPGGGLMGEMLIVSVYAFPPEVLPIIAVISTIIDAPATVLNSTGNTVCTMMITRLVEGKNWIIKSIAK